MSLPRIAGVLVVLVLSVSPAYADGFITPYVGYNFGGDSVRCVSLTACQEKQMNIGVSFRSGGKVAGLEEDIGYVKSFFGASGDRSVLTVMTSVVVSLPMGPVQPYVVGGIGLIRPSASYNPLQLFTSKSALGTDLGGGLTLMLGQTVGLRGDVRRFHTLQDVTLGMFTGERLDFWRASAGVTFNYGTSRGSNPYPPPSR